MDSPGYNILAQVTEDEMKAVRKHYNITKEEINSVIDSLLIWYKQQPHLPQHINIERNWIERVFVGNKCSMERSKERIDMTFAARNIMPYFFANRDPQFIFDGCRNGLITAPLPKLTPDFTRVFFTKVISEDPVNFNYDLFLKQVFLVHDYLRNCEYDLGFRIVVDMRGFSFGHLMKLTPSTVTKSEIVMKKVYGKRITSINLLFPNSVLEMGVKLIKSTLSEKLSTRLQVNSDLESFYKIVPKEICPSDYGGDEVSTEVIFRNWERELCSEKNLKWIEETEVLKSDESKRPGKAVTDEMLGIPGSFRTLIVD